jgi:hypothetical protein
LAATPTGLHCLVFYILTSTDADPGCRLGR